MGVNAYLLRTSAAPWFDSGARIRKAGRLELLACTQYHHLMEGRDLIRSGTVAEFDKDPRSIASAHAEGEKKTPPTMCPEGEFPL